MAATSGNGGIWQRGSGAGSLALDFAPEAISLYARARSGDWERIASAPTDAPDFADRIDKLRLEALNRDRTQSPVTLWLPADQIIERRYQLLASSDDARRAEAARRIASETEYTAAELSTAVADTSRTGSVNVLAVLLQTMIEARTYAANWGFTPGPISTRVCSEAFGGDGAVFEFPRSAADRAGPTFRRLAVAASVFAVIGGAAVGGYHLVQPMLQPAVEIRAIVPAPASFAVFLDPAPAAQRPFRRVEQATPSGLAPGEPSLPAETFRRAFGTASYAAVSPAGAPAELAAPAGTVPLKVGHAPAVPVIGGPAALPADAARAPAPAVAAPAREAGDTEVVAADDGKAADENLAPTAFAPETMTLQPAPRPAAEAPETAPEPEAEPGTETADAPPPPTEKPEPAVAATPAGEAAAPTVAAAAPPADAAADTPATAPAGADEATPSVFAALEAPAPSKRPRALQFAAKRAAPRSATPLSIYLPRSVTQAAGRTGLALDQTSLIGIIDASAGRQALVRLPDGSFQKVSRGDDVQGWRVSSISREAIRLTRKGQNRTLLLVTP